MNSFDTIILKTNLEYHTPIPITDIHIIAQAECIVILLNQYYTTMFEIEATVIKFLFCLQPIFINV